VEQGAAARSELLLRWTLGVWRRRAATDAPLRALIEARFSACVYRRGVRALREGAARERATAAAARGGAAAARRALQALWRKWLAHWRQRNGHLLAVTVSRRAARLTALRRLSAAAAGSKLDTAARSRRAAVITHSYLRHWHEYCVAVLAIALRSKTTQAAATHSHLRCWHEYCVAALALALRSRAAASSLRARRLALAWAALLDAAETASAESAAAAARAADCARYALRLLSYQNNTIRWIEHLLCPIRSSSTTYLVIF